LGSQHFYRNMTKLWQLHFHMFFNYRVTNNFDVIPFSSAGDWWYYWDYKIETRSRNNEIDVASRYTSLMLEDMIYSSFELCWGYTSLMLEQIRNSQEGPTYTNYVEVWFIVHSNFNFQCMSTTKLMLCLLEGCSVTYEVKF
jgi:hypothetical protein